MRHVFPLSVTCLLALAACQKLDNVGRAPAFTPLQSGNEYHAMYSAPLPDSVEPRRAVDGASLWTGDRQSLLGDRRAGTRGDILTVVIEINDQASISNSTGRSRTGSEQMGVDGFFGLPQSIDAGLPDGASLGSAVSTSSNGSFKGNGTVSRNEKLTLRIAATVVEVLPNGVLRIEGTQEVRVNFELRELTINGFARPGDISRQNEITYDKIAGARISYGGRGQISDVQQPRYGAQILDSVLPF